MQSTTILLILSKIKLLYFSFHFQESEEIVDLGVVEEVVRNSLCLASATMNLSTYLGLSNNIFSPTDYDFEPQLDIAEIKALTAVQPGVSHSITDHAELSHKIAEIYRVS